MLQRLLFQAAVCHPLPWAKVSPACATNKTLTDVGLTPLRASVASPLRATCHRLAVLRVGRMALADGASRVTLGGVASAISVIGLAGVSTLPATSVARLWMVYDPSVTFNWYSHVSAPVAAWKPEPLTLTSTLVMPEVASLAVPPMVWTLLPGT